MKNNLMDNGLCQCIANNPETCASCRFCLKHNSPEARKALCARIVNFLVFQPMYQQLVAATLPIIFPDRTVYEDEKDIAAMLFEAVIFEADALGETPFAYFLTRAPLSQDDKRLYQAWHRHTRFGFFTIQKIIPQKEVHLSDLAGKTSYKVYEKQGTTTFKEGAVIIARIVPFMDGWMFYSETIVSFSGVSQEWMKYAQGVKIPQLTFIQRYYRGRKRQLR